MEQVQGIFPIGGRILAQDEACRPKFTLCGSLLQLATEGESADDPFG